VGTGVIGVVGVQTLLDGPSCDRERPSVDGHPDPGQFDQEGVADGAGMQEVARLAVTA